MKKFYSMLAVLTALSLTSYASIAFDTSSNPEYDSGWNGGENGGYGFDPWTVSGVDGGRYLDSGTRGVKGFRQWSESWGNSEATRMFDSALSAGDTFSIDLGHNGGNDGEVGISLLSGATTKFNLKLVAGASYWQAWDGGNYDLNGDPPGALGDGIADYFTTDDWGGNPSTLQFTYNGGLSYGLTLFNSEGNGFSFDAHNAGHDISSINGVVVYSNNQGGGKNFWVDDLAVIPEPATIGLLGFVGSSLVWFRKRFAA